MNADCVFCREINGSRDTNFSKRYPELNNRILYETKSLVAFPCIGQLTKGHFLIVPKIHDFTFKHVRENVTLLKKELDEQINEMHTKLGFDAQKSLYFEHGALNSSHGGCGIYHAHIHVVPNAGFVNPREIFDFEKNKAHKNIDLALNNLTENGPYVLVGNAKFGYYSCSIKNSLPSQTLRKKVAKSIGFEKWDWRKTNREESMISILEDVS